MTDILKNPWRCSLHLFTSDVTRVLLLVYVLLWGVVALGFVYDTGAWRSARMWVIGLFVSVSSRTAGFTLIDFQARTSGFCLLVIGSMYIAAYPIAMLRKQGKAVRKNEDSRPVRPRKKIETIYKYWRAVLLSHTTWLYLVVVIIAYNEIGPRNPGVTLIAVLFEVVSAYGTVGYSFGPPSEQYPTSTSSAPSASSPSSSSSLLPAGPPNYSLAGTMHPVSKLCLMFCMMLGRNRGLPNHVYPKDMREGVKQEVDMADLEP